MLLSLLFPALLSAIAVFFASFLSWMVLPFHKQDWGKLAAEDDLMSALRNGSARPGSYMFPAPAVPGDMNNPEFQAKYKAGPKGVLTVFGDVNMGRNLGLTFVLFLVVSVCLAYLASLHIPAGAGFRPVFRFVSTAAQMAYLTGILQHSIWFQCRVTGHILESFAYAAITGAIFGALWPAAV
jgi:hypothetical protein